MLEIVSFNINHKGIAFSNTITGVTTLAHNVPRNGNSNYMKKILNFIYTIFTSIVEAPMRSTYIKEKTQPTRETTGGVTQKMMGDKMPSDWLETVNDITLAVVFICSNEVGFMTV